VRPCAVNTASCTTTTWQDGSAKMRLTPLVEPGSRRCWRRGRRQGLPAGSLGTLTSLKHSFCWCLPLSWCRPRRSRTCLRSANWAWCQGARSTCASTAGTDRGSAEVAGGGPRWWHICHRSGWWLLAREQIEGAVEVRRSVIRIDADDRGFPLSRPDSWHCGLPIESMTSITQLGSPDYQRFTSGQ